MASYEATQAEDALRPEPKMSIGRYITTRITTLKPPMTKVANPISLLATLNRQQWLFFAV